MKNIAVITCLLIFYGANLAFGANTSDIKRNYLFGEFQDITEDAKTITNPSDEMLYYIGLSYLKLGEYDKAREYFVRLTERFPSSRYYQRALLKTADAYFFDGQYAQAVSMYEDIKGRLSPDFAPILYLRFAQLAAKEGRWQDKDKFIQLIKTKYPDSPECKYAKIIESYDTFFTIQVGAFSNKGNAMEVKRDLAVKYQAYIGEDKKNSLSLYKVKVGKFKTRSEAERIRLKLLEDGYPAVIYP